MHITLPITPIRLSVCPSVRPPIHHAPSTHPSPFLHVRHTFLPASLLSSIPSSPPSPLLSLSITSGIITHVAFSACCFCFLLTALHGLQAVRFPTGINPSPLQWKIRILTPGHQESPSACFFHLGIDLEYVPLLVHMDFPCFFFNSIYCFTVLACAKIIY